MRYAFSNGQKQYSNRSMLVAHSRLFDMGLGGNEFDIVAGHLVATLKSFNVPDDIVNDIVAKVSPLRDTFVKGNRA